MAPTGSHKALEMTRDLVTIGNATLKVDLATGFGPRVVGLRPSSEKNLLAELDGLGIDLPDGRRFSFRGGHRLWMAPEIPAVTYEPDDAPVEITADRNSASARVQLAGIAKTIRVEVGNDERTVIVGHQIGNCTQRSVSIAPWAITQFKTGGVAILPLERGGSGSAGLQATSTIIGWPYTDWASLEGDLANSALRISGVRTSPTKIGTTLKRGWLGYINEGWLFAKYANESANQIDLGAQAQIYANADFVELETLGSSVVLAPGDSVEHQEVWRIWPAPDSLGDAAELAELGRPYETNHPEATS